MDIVNKSTNNKCWRGSGEKGTLLYRIGGNVNWYNCLENSMEFLNLKNLGVPMVAQWLTNPTGNQEVSGLIPGLAQCVKDLILP